MKSCLLALSLLLCLAPALGGNRADVNADQVVNAADTVLLANIVAGNLDVANYELESVVVVAPQGGDFTNPADAAYWVQSQSPGPTHRFVILVTPGEYAVNYTIDLPGYTTLQGYGRRATRIVGSSLNTSWIVRVYDVDQVAIRDLSLHLASGSSTCIVVGLYYSEGCVLEGLDLSTEDPTGPNFLIQTESISGDFRELELTQGTGSPVPYGIVLNSSQVNFDHCQVKLSDAADFEMIGLFLTGSEGVILRDCRISVTNTLTGYGATAVKVESPQSYAVFKDCHLQALSVSPVGQNNFYFYSDATTHTVRFFQCQLDGARQAGSANLFYFGCSTSLGVAVP